MKSEPPPNSASFDSLWDAVDAGEEDLPPALAPRLQGTVLPQEDRDTLLPPVPPGEYVQAMMELGELDDPLDLPPLHRTAPVIPAAPLVPSPSPLPRRQAARAGAGVRGRDAPRRHPRSR